MDNNQQDRLCPLATAAPVIVERDIYVDENGNEIPAPVASNPLADPLAAAEAPAPATTPAPAYIGRKC